METGKTKHALFTVVALIVVVLLGSTLGCKTIEDFTVTSAPAADNHTHTLTIFGSSVSYPPREVIKTTSKGGTPEHTHAVKLTQVNYQALKKGETITLTSSPYTGDDHTHEFTMKVP